MPRKKRVYKKGAHNSEYDHQGTPAQIKRRSGRNKAAKLLKCGKGKHAHHKDKNPLNNKRSNITCISKKKNQTMQPKRKKS